MILFQLNSTHKSCLLEIWGNFKFLKTKLKSNILANGKVHKRPNHFMGSLVMLVSIFCHSGIYMYLFISQNISASVCNYLQHVYIYPLVGQKKTPPQNKGPLLDDEMLHTIIMLFQIWDTLQMKITFTSTRELN